MGDKTYPIINNFSSGELSSRMEGRVDLRGYFEGCKIMQNCLMVSQGGAEKRPGTKYLGEAYNPPTITATIANVKLIPFEVNDSEIYIVELGHGYLRVWDVLDESLVQDGGGDLVIETEYSSNDVNNIQYAQTEGILFFAHENYIVKQLIKTDSGFSFEAMGFIASTWDVAVNYTRGDLVVHNGDYFSAQIDNIGNTPSTGEWTLMGSVPTDLSGDILVWAGGTYNVGDYTVHEDILWRCLEGHTNKKPGPPESVPTYTWDHWVEITPRDWEDYGDGSLSMGEWLDLLYGAGNWKNHGRIFGFAVWEIEYRRTDYIEKYYWEDAGVTLMDIRPPETLFEWDVADTYQLNDYAYDPTTYELYRSLQNSNTGALTEGRYWDAITGNPLFNETGDYPSAISFMENRLYLGGTKNSPQTISASKIGNFKDFSSGADDDDAFSFTIAADRASRIKWMVAKDVLTIGTSSSEWVATGGQTGMTPTNVQVLRQSAYGSQYQQAIFVADSLLFFQKGGRKLREYKYSNDNRAYLANDLTFFSDHITRTGILQSSYQQNPDSILWAARADGYLIGLTYDSLNRIFGWHRHITQGLFESVVSVSGQADEDELWFIIKRNIDGTEVKYIEKLTTRIIESQKDLVYSDSSLTQVEGDYFSISNITWAADKITITYYGVADFVDDDRIKITETEIPGIDTMVFTVDDLNTVAKTFTLFDPTIGNYYTLDEFDDTEVGKVAKANDTVTGLSHLEGESVSILGDGAVFPNEVVSLGEITIRNECTAIIVGLPYKMKLQPESIEIPNSSSMRSSKRVSKVTLKLYNTLGGKVGPDEDNLTNMDFRRTDLPFGVPPNLFTGNKEVQIDGSSGAEATVLIVHDQPLPMTILAIISDITYDRS